MSRMTVLTILLSAAIILVAPQVFAAVGDWIHLDPGHVGQMGESAYTDTPTATCTVDYGATGHGEEITLLDEPAIGHGGSAYSSSEHPVVASTCDGKGSSLSAKDLQVPNAPEIWDYR